MNELQIFENPKFGKIRTVIREGEPWFVAADICAALEIAQQGVALQRLDDDEKGLCSANTLGGKQKVSIISESGLYVLVLGSRKPEAKAFKRWVTHDVIPAIRKHGAYMTPKAAADYLRSPEGFMVLLQEFANVKEQNHVLTVENNALAEKALKWEKKAFINAAVRKYATGLRGSDYGVRVGVAWKEFKKELLYRSGVNVEERLTRMRNASSSPSTIRTLDCIAPHEEDRAVATIVTLCREKDVDISELLKNIDYTEPRKRRKEGEINE